MRGESQFGHIAYAGEILFNNQRGLPSLSTLSSLFSDHKIRFKTDKNIDSQDKNETTGLHNTSMRSRFYGVEPVEITLKSRTDDSSRSLSTYASMQLKDVTIDHGLTKKYSDFLFKFNIASQILSATAIEWVTLYIKKTQIDPRYTLRDESDAARRSLLIILFREGMINGMRASFVEGRWSQFMMLPDFDLALKQNKFSPKEIKEDLMGFGLLSRYFQKSGVLVRNSLGRLEWISDKDKLFNSWIIAAEKTSYGDPTQEL